MDMADKVYNKLAIFMHCSKTAFVFHFVKQKEISSEEAEEWAKTNDVLFIETSVDNHL